MMMKSQIPYSSSPNFPLVDWSHVDDMDLYNCENGIIKPDLFEDIFWSGSSIHSDIQRIESCDEMTTDNVFDDALLSESDLLSTDIKPEIRNIDCMWSASINGGNVNNGGSNSILSTSASSVMSSDSVTSGVPFAAVTSAGSAQNLSVNNSKQQTPLVVVANKMKTPRQQQQQQLMSLKSNKQERNPAQFAIKTEIKSEPEDDYEQQLLLHNNLLNNNIEKQQQQQVQRDILQNIPPGASLLRKSNNYNNKKAQQQIQIPKMEPAQFLRERDQQMNTDLNTTGKKTQYGGNSSYLRPDTPHSLDDDATEFKHSVDLRACVMGSNNIALTTDSANFIHHLSQELQDTSKTKIDMHYGITPPSLAEVCDIINGNGLPMAETKLKCYRGGSTIIANSLSRLGLEDVVGSDYDTDEEEGEEEDESIAGDSSSGDSGLSLLDGDMSYCASSPVHSQDSNSVYSNNSSSHHHHHHRQSYLHSDHSYTRCKDGMDDLGTNLETPSDSDEEIDVVSINDKKLPTNPSDKDRKALQTKVASKFTNRIVKTANGVRTIPPRRRGSYVFPYTPASSSPVKSVASTRYPSPTSTPFQNQSTTNTKYLQQQEQTTSSSAPINILADKSRKRFATFIVSPGTSYVVPPSKRNRNKKGKHQYYTCNGNTTSSSMAAASSNIQLKRNASVIHEEAESIEKRTLHNDMERQRRIGLKNLFDALKKQIPSIKDKERAPKVNILREAAKLCESLTLEDQQLCEQKILLKEQLKKRQEHLARLRALTAGTITD